MTINYDPGVLSKSTSDMGSDRPHEQTRESGPVIIESGLAR
jgi:hypothetical protein